MLLFPCSQFYFPFVLMFPKNVNGQVPLFSEIFLVCCSLYSEAFFLAIQILFTFTFVIYILKLFQFVLVVLLCLLFIIVNSLKLV